MTTILFALASLSAPHHAAPLPPVKAFATWERCDSVSGCAWFPIKRAPRRPIGHWHSCSYSFTRTVCRTFPVFRVRHAQHRQNATKPMPRAVAAPVASSSASRGGTNELAYVTGYSWGCGTPNGIMASGYRPYVGAVSNDSLPFGTHIFVPSLDYSGTVLDRGVGTGGFDLFMPSCTAALTVTGWRTVVIG